MQTRLVFASSGEPIAFLESKNVFTLDGMWVGFSPDGFDLYDRNGVFVGLFLKDGRIAFDPTKPSPPPIDPPQPAVATGIPYAIPHRPPLPSLPKPFKEPMLEAQDGNTRPLTFVATQLAIFFILAVSVAYAGWKLGEVDIPADNQRITILTYILGAAVVVLFAAAIKAFRNSTTAGRRLLLVGSTERRQRIGELLADLNLQGASIVQVDSEAKPNGAADAFVRSFTENKNCDYVLLANIINTTDGLFLPDFKFDSNEAAPRSKLVDIPALLERERGQLIPLANSTAKYFQYFLEHRRSADKSLTRMLDIVLSALLILLSAPAMVITAISIKLESRGPVFYRQERIGLNGNPFLSYKFRSMRLDAEKASGPSWATSGGSRITQVGRVIRLLRLDELPQLINVLWGDMSVVGPRPERPALVDVLTDQIPPYRWRHLVKPGITGWAQVRYQYGATIEDSYQKLGYDLYYVKHQSVFLDLVIIFETVGVVLTGQSAR